MTNIKKLKTRNFVIGDDHPVYYIADIAANHGGDLSVAKELIHAAADSGASAAKFQNFTAESLVSSSGFNSLSVNAPHQDKWEESVFDSYDRASLSLDWTKELMETAHNAGIDYFTSAYSVELLEATLPYIDAIKIGSGDITYHQIIEIASKVDIPFFIATGASTNSEVELAVECISKNKDTFCLMQCNTDYTAETNDDDSKILNRYKNINLKCLETYAQKYENIILGLSDHTHGSLTVLGAVGLYNCAVVEKHFTLDNSLKGQDHSFSMTPNAWRKMVDQGEELRLAVKDEMNFDRRFKITSEACGDFNSLKASIGSGSKEIMDNERETRVVQRRSICLSRDLVKGNILTKKDFDFLRPCPQDSFAPYQAEKLIGKVLNIDLEKGSPLLASHFNNA